MILWYSVPDVLRSRDPQVPRRIALHQLDQLMGFHFFISLQHGWYSCRREVGSVLLHFCTHFCCLRFLGDPQCANYGALCVPSSVSVLPASNLGRYHSLCQRFPVPDQPAQTAQPEDVGPL